jgi:hypothetical protein
MRDKASLKTWATLLVVFALGCVTGIGVDGVYRSRTSASFRESRAREHEKMFEKIRTDLSLNDDQANAMRRVLDETANEFRGLRSELRPRYEELRQKTRARMRALLTPEQQQKFDRLMAEIDAQRQKSGH